MENPRGNCAPALPGMVWYGMERYGCYDYGMVVYRWYGMVVYRWYGMAWFGYGMVVYHWYGMVGAAALPGEANHAHSIATAPRDPLLHLKHTRLLTFIPLFHCAAKKEPCLAVTPTYEICCQSARPTQMYNDDTLLWVAAK